MTRSLDSAIMAPSLKTASSTMRMVGKYLDMQLCIRVAWKHPASILCWL